MVKWPHLPAPPILSPCPGHNTYPLSILARGPKKALDASITLENGQTGRRGLRIPNRADTDPLQLANQFQPLRPCWDPQPPSLALRFLPPNILTLCPFSPGSPGSPSKPRSP